MPTYRCEGRKVNACTHESTEAPWRGRCPGCGGYYAILKIGPNDTEANARRSVAQLALKPKVWISTGIPQVDRVLGGGGLVPGSTVFLGGGPGSGKSTLALQIADNVAQQAGKRVLFASAEQMQEDVGQYAQRLGCRAERLEIAHEIDVYKIIDDAKEMNASLLVVDSLQTVSLEDVDAAEGTGAQVNGCADVITAFGKREKMAIIVICQINKTGELAGTKKAEHACDTVTYLEKDEDYDEDGDMIEDTRGLRAFSVEKNRNGEEGLRESLRMTAKGVHPDRKRSKLER